MQKWEIIMLYRKEKKCYLVKNEIIDYLLLNSKNGWQKVC